MSKMDWQRLLPKFWMQNDPTDWDWDADLNRLLDLYEPVVSGPCSVSFGGIEVWASNYPYAFGSPYTPKMNVLPSVATRKRLLAAVKEVRRQSFRAAIAKAEGPKP